MVYIIDEVNNLVASLSDGKTSSFQRGGTYCVMGTSHAEPVFGQIMYGLQMHPERILDWNKLRTQPAEFLASREIHSPSRKKRIPARELPYLQPLLFSPRRFSFTLEEVTKATETLRHLRDDGNIRMFVRNTCSNNSSLADSFGYIRVM